MKNQRFIFTAVLALACLGRLQAFEVESLPLHLYLAGLTEARAPAIVDDHLVLSAQGVYRSVGAAFSNEGWKTIHPFEKNMHGVFVLALPVPYGDASTVSYRLVMDGLWSVDPSNARRSKDPGRGISVSLVDYPARPLTEHGTWNPALGAGEEGSVLFFFRGEPGERVTVAGSFNGWDPFLHELHETLPGQYELSLELQPGTYQYVFIYNGERIQDPLNDLVLYGKDGRPVSSVTVGNGTEGAGSATADKAVASKPKAKSGY